MKRFFSLLVMAAAAMALFSGCQKYDDTQIRQEIKDLGERVTKLEAWCKSSQAAVDAVATLQEAVKNMRSVESVEYFIEEDGSGYIITFTNKQTIKLYNGEDGDAFFGNVNVGSTSIEFILADGTSFVVDRVTNSIGFESYETMTVARGDTIWTVMNEAFTKSEYAAFTAELKTDDGTATSIATKSATGDGKWKIEAVAPEFKADGSIARPAGVVIADSPEVGGKGVLKVSLVTNNGKETSSSLVVDIVPNYLAFEAVEAGATVSMEIVGECESPSLKYSTDLTEWTDFDFSNPQTITLENVGDKVYWHNAGKADYFSKDADNYVHFVLGDKKIAASGNVMSLVDSSCTSKSIPSESCFVSLFNENAFLVKGPQLPATELKPNCYSSMFRDCAALEKAPELPATELPESCYYCMFRACSSLTEVSDLPANKVGYGSCFAMFRDCSSLEKAPALPAKQIDAYCYQQMFWGCSFKKAPELPATELARSCYSMMFSECKSLKEAPVLPALKMAEQCYFAMFQACGSLETAPELPAMDLAGDCYSSMFLLCSSLKNAPALPATQLEPYCYNEMFIACESLVKAPKLPATELAEGCYWSMFRACSSLEAAPALPATKLASYCYYSMFAECSSLKSAPELPATELAENCYGFMFNACSSLEAAPELPATELAPYCYYVMFAECSSLESAPELPATELAENCYGFMFGSSGLKKAPELPATELAPGCYFAMFTGCYSLEKAPELPAKKLAASCYESMFDDCPKLNYIKVGFEDWCEDIGATAGWVVGVGSEGVFECPESLAVKYGEGCIPTGWSVNGAAPVAMKSFAAPATKSIIGSLRKSLAPKTLKIQDSPVRHELIAL